VRGSGSRNDIERGEIRLDDDLFDLFLFNQGIE